VGAVKHVGDFETLKSGSGAFSIPTGSNYDFAAARTTPLGQNNLGYAGGDVMTYSEGGCYTVSKQGVVSKVTTGFQGESLNHTISVSK
jgi:hypothetical protein